MIQDDFDEFSKIGKKWAKVLEIQKPESCTEEEYAEFSAQNKNHFVEIENFILIVNDWVE